MHDAAPIHVPELSQLSPSAFPSEFKYLPGIQQPSHDHPYHGPGLSPPAVTDPATDPSSGSAVYHQQHSYGTLPVHEDSFGGRTAREREECNVVLGFVLLFVAITMCAVAFKIWLP